MIEVITSCGQNPPSPEIWVSLEPIWDGSRSKLLVVQSLVSRVWCPESGVQSLVSRVWCPVCVQSLVSRVWCPVCVQSLVSSLCPESGVQFVSRVSDQNCPKNMLSQI